MCNGITLCQNDLKENEEAHPNYHCPCVCACVCMCTPTKMVLVGTQKPLHLIGQTLSSAAVSSICGNLLLAPALR